MIKKTIQTTISLKILKTYNFEKSYMAFYTVVKKIILNIFFLNSNQSLNLLIDNLIRKEVNINV